MDEDSHCGPLPPAHHVQHNYHHTHHTRHMRHRHISSEDGAEEEELDPRIQVELEKLNRATEEINRLELELDDARASFRQVLSDSSQRLNGLAKKLGTCVDKARPYYDARMKLKESHLESQKAALRFERACSMHEAAKEMVQLAEEGYKRREEDLDPTWQEMLNHATMKVNDAERERIESEEHHQSTTLNFKKREEEVQKLQRDLKRAITKSKPYFEMKAKFNQVMEDHKRNVSRLEEDVASTKALYSEALRNLEAISDDIHRQRLERRQNLQLGIRGPGVGAESPSPPPSWDKGINIDGSACQVYGSDLDEDADQRARHHGTKRLKEQGIVGYELPLCHQSSLSDENDIETGVLKSDPLNLVIFKNEGHFHHDEHYHHTHNNSSSYGGVNNFLPPSVIHSDVRCARSLSYRQAVDRNKDDDGSDPGNETETIVGRTLHSDEDGKEKEMNADHQIHLSSLSPKSLGRREVDSMQSSLSRAQEWVNKSPIPQQRRFIKSKSLIDASSPPPNFNSDPEGKSSSSNAPSFSSSLTTEALRLMTSNARLQDGGRNNSGSHPKTSALSARLSQQHLQQQRQQSPPHPNHHHHHHLQSQPDPTTPTTVESRDALQQIQPPHLSTQTPPSTTTTDYHYYPRSSPRSVSTPSDRSSPRSDSPSGKSPKLQGLILRVDAAGIPSSPSPTVSSSSKQPSLGNSAIISTKMSTLGVLNQQQHPQLSPSSSSLSSPSLSPGVATTRVVTSPNNSHYLSTNTTPSNLNPPLSSSTSPLQPSLLPNTKPSLGFKLPSYSSKTAPSAFHLPSPTRSRTNLSSLPTPALKQIVSPTPPSPSADRVSILSGRSDSSRGGLLRPPSDSSDTESIASTGPMLDDDQVELLTLDFSEQSISSASQNPVEDGDFTGETGEGVARLQRGNWSRSSLPPRLSYLGGYFERTRQLVHNGGVLVGGCEDKNIDDDNDLSPPVGDEEMMRECEDEQNDEKDEKEEDENSADVSEETACEVEKDKPAGDSSGEEENLAVDVEGSGEVSVSIRIQVEESGEREDDSNENEEEKKEDGRVGDEEYENGGVLILGEKEKKDEGEMNECEITTTIVMSPDGNIQSVEDDSAGTTEV